MFGGWLGQVRLSWQQRLIRQNDIVGKVAVAATAVSKLTVRQIVEDKMPLGKMAVGELTRSIL